MAFSFRNLFKKDEDNPGDATGEQQAAANPLDDFGRSPSPQDPSQSAAGSSPFFAPQATQQHAPALPINVPAAQVVPHIPRELANPHGLAPDAIVRLPAAGPSGGLRLTEVYQACPALFSYAPDVRDSREIFVGLHAIEPATANQSPFAVQNQNQPQHQSATADVQPPPPATSPFSPALAEEAPATQSPTWQSVSPFETSSLDQHPKPFETGSLPPAQPAAFETGFLTQNQNPGHETGSHSAPDPSQAEHGNQLPQPTPDSNQAFFNPPPAEADSPPARPATQELEASALPFAPAPRVEAPEESGEIELSLLNLLRGIPQEDLGFDPEEVPSDVRVQLPLSLIRPQLSSGNVVVPLTEIIAGCDERYHPAFAHSREDTQVPLPLQEIFHNLPGDIPEAPSTAEFVARQQAEGAPIFDPTAPVQTDPQSPAAEPPTAPPWQNQPEPEPEPEITPAHPASADPENAGFAEPATPPNSPFFTPEKPQTGLSSQQLLGSPFSVQEPAPDSAHIVPPAPFPPVDSPEPTPVASQPQPESAAPSEAEAPADAAGYDFAAFDQQTDLDQLALRAIFQVEERLTAQGVLDLCCGLPGVGACVALHPGGALSAEKNSGTEFGEDAAGMFQNVAGLARGLGIGEADTFTIRTRKGTFSFFSQGDLCLGVLHDPGHPTFGPGAREKLVLVARELGSMISA